MERTAVISPCGLYRYNLTRRWGIGLPLVFIMLNPSTADAHADDATIRKCIGFASRYGYQAIEVVNLFAFRATNPKDMLRAVDPIGPENDKHILKATSRCDVVCAWGPNASKTHRPSKVLNMLIKNKTNPYCLHMTKDGSPGHPLMLSYDRDLLDYMLLLHLRSSD